MKRVLFSVAILAASVCAADEITSSNVLGILPVTSSAKRTIVSVPWCAMSATDNAAIQVSNLVKTANLTVNDMLHVYNSGAFQSWKLAEDSESKVKYWQSVNQVGEDGASTETPSSSEFAAMRGTAIMLIRQDVSNPFYLYGQVGSGDVVTTITARGTAASPAYTLVAPAGVAGADLCASGVCSDIPDGDEVYVTTVAGLQVQYTRKNGSWSQYRFADGAWSWIAVEHVNVPAGLGFWYVSNTSEGSVPKFNW